MLVTTILSIAVLGAVNLTAHVSRNVSRTNTYRQAVEIGDGATDYLFTFWREKCRPLHSVNYLGQDFSSLPLPDATYFPSVTGFTATAAGDRTKTVSNMRIRALNANWKPVADNADVPAVNGMSLGTVSYYYLATADVTLPTQIGRASCRERV